MAACTCVDYGHVQENEDGGRLVVDVHVYVYVDATGDGGRPMRGHGET